MKDPLIVKLLMELNYLTAEDITLPLNTIVICSSSLSSPPQCPDRVLGNIYFLSPFPHGHPAPPLFPHPQLPPPPHLMRR